MRAACCITLGVLFALLTTSSASAMTTGFTLSPVRYDLVAPTGSKAYPISVTNHTRSDVQYTISKEDYQGDRDDPASTPLLLGGRRESAISGWDWLTIPDQVTVPAGATRTFSVTVSPPANSTGGHYVAVVVSGPARNAGNMVLRSRGAVLFLINSGGVPPPEIVIREVRKVGPATTVTEYVNEGSTEVTPDISVTRDPVGPGKTRTFSGTCTTALPGGAGSCTAVDPTRIDKPQPGADGVLGTEDDVQPVRSGNLPVVGPVEQYVDLIGDPDEEGTSAREKLPTEWAGATRSALLPLVGIALFVLYFLFLRRRRKDAVGFSGFGAD